jgi:hypothetical protein
MAAAAVLDLYLPSKPPERSTEAMRVFARKRKRGSIRDFALLCPERPHSEGRNGERLEPIS